MTKASDPFHWPVRVYYEDTDASGVVYHANYLKYFERGRSEWLRALGLDQTSLGEELDIAFTLVSAQLEFKKPARLDDELTVVTRVERRQRASMTFAQHIQRAASVLVEGRFRVACVDFETFKPQALPQAMNKEFA